jgi:hypothetical protein
MWLKWHACGTLMCGTFLCVCVVRCCVVRCCVVRCYVVRCCMCGTLLCGTLLAIHKNYWLVIFKTTIKRWQHGEHRSLERREKITWHWYSEKMRYQSIVHILQGITLLQWEIHLCNLCMVGNIKRPIWISTTISHSFTFYISHSAYFFGNDAYVFRTQSQWNYTHHSV